MHFMTLTINNTCACSSVMAHTHPMHAKLPDKTPIPEQYKTNNQRLWYQYALLLLFRDFFFESTLMDDAEDCVLSGVLASSNFCPAFFMASLLLAFLRASFSAFFISSTFWIKASWILRLFFHSSALFFIRIVARTRIATVLNVVCFLGRSGRVMPAVRIMARSALLLLTIVSKS